MTTRLPAKIKWSSPTQGDGTRNAFFVIRPPFFPFPTYAILRTQLSIATGSPIINPTWEIRVRLTLKWKHTTIGNFFIVNCLVDSYKQETTLRIPFNKIPLFSTKSYTNIALDGLNNILGHVGFCWKMLDQHVRTLWDLVEPYIYGNNCSLLNRKSVQFLEAMCVKLLQTVIPLSKIKPKQHSLKICSYRTDKNVTKKT